MSDIKIYAISRENSNSVYDNYDSSYNSYIDQYSASIKYGKTAWIVAPETTTSGAFVGWYNTQKEAFVSYDSQYKFIITQNIELIPIYSDNLAITVSNTPYAIAEDALYEVYADDAGTTKVKYVFPMSFFIPDSTIVDEYKVRYQVTQAGDTYDINGQWTEYDLTGTLNAQDRVNFYLTSNYYNAQGDNNELTIHLQPYVIYDGTDTKGDTKAIVSATYEYPVI